MTAIRSAFLLAMLILCGSFAPGDYTLVRQIPFSQAVLSTDRMGNAYVIAINQLLKFDPDGNPVSNFGLNNYGFLRSADCSDPLKLVLFYYDFARIVTLNNKLALESTTELRSLGFVDPTLVCSSANLGYWVFDQAGFQLKKVDPSLRIVYESGNLQQLLGQAIHPTLILEDNNYVYLGDPENGILVFDLYGVYYKTIPLRGVRSFQARGDRLLLVRDNAFFSYDQKRLELTEIGIPPHDSLLNARIEQNRLYLLSATALSIYSF